LSKTYTEFSKTLVGRYKKNLTSAETTRHENVCSASKVPHISKLSCSSVIVKYLPWICY